MDEKCVNFRLQNFSANAKNVRLECEWLALKKALTYYTKI
jgi:hypothetical protein